jgi:hypothetical protein
MRSTQRGLAGALIAVVLVLAAVIALASLVLTRVNRSAERTTELAPKFEAIKAALVQHVASTGRLPCPADPTVDDGAAVPAVAGPCTHVSGTVPWRTIGLRQSDAIDPWTNKISYRVYTGAAGSLTQDGGASLVNCDLGDTGAKDGTTGLCIAAPRDTGPDQFILGKGFSVTDNGTKPNVAFVLISHGPSGLGAYTTAGKQRDMPATGGDERTNTEANGPFVMKAFSEISVAPTDSAHFDDYVSYMGIKELAQAAGVYARHWPEEAGTTPTSVTFTQGVVEAAVGGAVTPGSGVGQVSVTFNGVVISNPAAGATDQISFESIGGYGGLGVAGGGSSLIQSSANEKLSLSFAESFTKFAVTLNDFGYYNSQYYEIAEFRFYLGGNEVSSPRYGVGCRIDGGLASFTMDTTTLFDRVEIIPYPAYDLVAGTFTAVTAFLVTDVKACPASEPTCTTSLAAAGNNCAVY